MDNVTFPWAVIRNYDRRDNQGIILALEAVFDQLQRVINVLDHMDRTR